MRRQYIDTLTNYCNKQVNCDSCLLRKNSIAISSLYNYMECDFEGMSDEDLKLFYNTISAAEDMVNHPSHYTDGKIEVIDYIEDKKLGFCLGNAVKYISRAGKKDSAKEIEDLKKAAWYVDRRIKELVKDGRPE